MNESQKQLLRSIVHKCSEHERAFLYEQFAHAHGVTQEEHQNLFKAEDFETAMHILRE